MLIVLNWNFNLLEQLFSCTLHKTYVIPSHVTLLGLITKITDDSMLSDIINLPSDYHQTIMGFETVPGRLRDKISHLYHTLQVLCYL